MRFESGDVRAVILVPLLLADVPTLWYSYRSGGRLCGMVVLLLLAPHSRSSS